MKLTRNKALIALGLVIVVAILAFSARRQRTPSSQYFTSQVDTGPLRNVVNATGVVQTVVTVQVGSQVSGQVEELYADFNSVVRRGQLLAKIDPRNFQAQVENADASVAAARLSPLAASLASACGWCASPVGTSHPSSSRICARIRGS